MTRVTAETRRKMADTAAPALVDAHVHIHPGFDPVRFLEGALSNVRRGAARLGLSADTPGWLLLTETARDHAFAAFADRAGGAAAGGWSLRATAEADSLVASRDGREVLGVVAGRQIVTREGLEVLALGTMANFADGAGLDKTLAEVRDASALPVLPWGVGKWSGRRGDVIAERIRNAAPGELFVGDNGNRLAAAPRPRLLDVAEASGLVVLPGSDPLPLAGAEAQVASFGFVLEAPLAAERPAAGLKGRIRALAASPPVFGRPAAPAAFVRNQILMQMRKHGIVN